MTTPQAQKLILLAGSVSISSLGIGKALDGNVAADTFVPPVKGGLPRIAIGTILAMAGLSITAEVSPEIAAGLAVAMGGTAFVTYGLPLILAYFSSATGIKPAPRKTTTKSPKISTA